MTQWRNEGEFIVVSDESGERRLNTTQAREYRSTLQWPDECSRFQTYVDRQLLVTDADFAKACAVGLIQIGHPRHETKQ